MKPYAEVIGDPISHSKSPFIHNFWLRHLGIDAEYRAHRVQTAQLEAYLADRLADPLWRGCNVTIPHKEAVYRLLVEQGHGTLWPGEGDFGALNTVAPNPSGAFFGRNTDVEGVVGPLNQYLDERYGYQPPPALNIAIIGAGGAARAALWGLKNHPHQFSFTILVRRPEQGEVLLDAMNVRGQVKRIAPESLEGIDVLINASPLGMVGKPPLLLSPAAMRRENAVIFDMVYAPLETELMRQAETLGINFIDGLQMLVGQAGGAFQTFFGKAVPRDLLREVHLRLRQL